jgi:hypothetical protein
MSLNIDPSQISVCFAINNGWSNSSSLFTGLSFTFTFILKVKGLHSVVKSEDVYKDNLFGLQEEVLPCYVIC